MTKREVGILVVLGIFVVLLIVFGAITKKDRERLIGNLESELSETPVTEAPLPSEEVDFVPSVPENIIETTPVAEAPAAPGSTAKLGGYEIEIRSTGFIPPQLVVKKGDVVQIKITASDGKYDFVIPYLEMSLVINEGETRQMTFRADSTGTFVFECKDFCPSGDLIRGAIVVKE